MQFLKENLFKLIAICILIILFICIYSYINLKREYMQYRQELNKTISAIVSIVTRNYPNVEQNIINELSNLNNENVKQGENILSRYGIDIYEVMSISNIEQMLKYNLRFNICIIFLLGISLILVFIIYTYITQNKLNKLIKFLKKIQNGEYSLDIRDNNEGRLSELKNEIYKITVMLKEESKMLKTEKKALAESLSDISHQIKTPLTSISVLIDILKENKNLPEQKRQEFLYEITRQLNWLNWLVISLLKLSKLDTGTVEFKKEKIIVKDLLQQVEKNIAVLLDIKNQELEITGDEKAIFIGDINWSTEAIINIVKNCIEHTDEFKTIQIKYLENTLYTQIKITDQGKGISKEDLPYIFTRFYKGKNSSKDSIGIGLALAKSIIEKQGGNISVTSIENVGSEFIINIYKGII